MWRKRDDEAGTCRTAETETSRRFPAWRARAVAVAAAFLAAMFAAGAPAARAAQPQVESPASQSAAEPLLAYSARIAGDDARTRIVIEFDRKPDIVVHYVANPFRILIDLPETAFALKPADLEARGLFTDIRFGAMAAGRSRIVLTATRPVAIVVADVQEEQGAESFRLVLDAAIVTEQDFAARVEAQKWQQTAATGGTAVAMLPAAGERAEDGTFVVAVDAGHGGIDNGARGVETKTEEKHVTLAFARVLVGKLNALPGIKAVLTRDKDEFLSLPQRVQLARGAGADLFISIHADTLRQKDIRGATVYTISDRASDSLAAGLAERENLSDEIAGIPLQNEPAEVADILIDLTRRETQTFSINLARSVVATFEGQVKLINNPHRHAGFRVLQAPDVPSILLELGFLSNAEDEKLLLDPTWHERVSDLIGKAVDRYRQTVVATGQ
nr:N-acetylmuramoyl-L-alanine amidase [Rhizobium alarense]